MFASSNDIHSFFCIHLSCVEEQALSVLKGKAVFAIVLQVRINTECQKHFHDGYFQFSHGFVNFVIVILIFSHFLL